MTRITEGLTTDQVLQEIGERLRGYRLQQNRRLEDLAAAAGVGIQTAFRAESGANPTLATIVRLLRELGRLNALDAFLPEPGVSPIELAKLQGRVRQRARPASPPKEAELIRPRERDRSEPTTDAPRVRRESQRPAPQPPAPRDVHHVAHSVAWRVRNEPQDPGQ